MDLGFRGGLEIIPSFVGLDFTIRVVTAFPSATTDTSSTDATSCKPSPIAPGRLSSILLNHDMIDIRDGMYLRQAMTDEFEAILLAELSGPRQIVNWIFLSVPRDFPLGPLPCRVSSIHDSRPDIQDPGVVGFTRNTPQTMASLLPRELLDTVMDYLLEADDDQSSSLKAASLVCRSFLPSSESRLFATISLRAPRHKREKAIGCRLPGPFIPTNLKRGFKSSIEAFSRAVADSPHLLGYVRHLNLHGSHYPLRPPLPPDHSDWLNSQSLHLMTFLPNVAPKLRSFGMYTVNWDKLLPEILETITTIFGSKLLTTLTLESTINLPISALASCEHLQHLNLRGGGNWDSSALTCPVSNHQLKSQLISLKLVAPYKTLVDWFSTEYCIFDISHLRHLAVFQRHHDLAKIFQICSDSLETLEMPAGYPTYPPAYDFDSLNISSLAKLRKVHFHLSLHTSAPVPSEPRNPLLGLNDILRRQSQMLALEEIILDCSVTYRGIPLDLTPFSETDSVLARGENLPALRSVTILVGCDLQRYTYKVVATIMMRMPLLRDMGIVRVIRGA